MTFILESWVDRCEPDYRTQSGWCEDRKSSICFVCTSLKAIYDAFSLTDFCQRLRVEYYLENLQREVTPAGETRR